MTRIILNGCNGKMGQVISRIVSEDESFKIAAGLDINTYTQNPYPVYTNPDDCVENADVIIDFSHPSALEGLLDFAKNRNMPIVVATTGLSDEQKKLIEKSASEIPVFFSANMSLGINLLMDLARKATKLLGNKFDIEIIEKHHNQKLDAPSGTALALADAISETLENPAEFVYDRHSVRRKRRKNEIGIHAVRGGTIVGEHEIIFAGNDEVIELKHTAASKEVFAEGAVKAAEFMKGKPTGLYSMADLIDETN